MLTVAPAPVVDLAIAASSKNRPPRASGPPARRPGFWGRCRASSGRFWARKRPGWPKVKLPLSSGAWSSMIRVPCRSGPSASTPTRSAPSARPERESTRSPQPTTLPLSVYRNDHRLSPQQQEPSPPTSKACAAASAAPTYDKAPIHVCEMCFGPLEVAYDYARIGKVLTRAAIEARPASMWRYAELLPLDGPPTVGQQSGLTPLVRADAWPSALGLKEVWVKNDAVSHPTLSFKDRVVSVALSKAREFGFDTVACASTGNLANSTAAHAAAAGLPAVRLDPPRSRAGQGPRHQHLRRERRRRQRDLRRRQPAVLGDRRQVRLGLRQRQPAPVLRRGLEDLRLRDRRAARLAAPAHVVVPMAGGSLVTKIGKAFGEFAKLGLVAGAGAQDAHHGAQAEGCAPIIDMVLENRDHVRPVKTPNTIAKSLAIGNPADGYYARQTILGSGGWAAKPNDDEIVAAMRLLAETEGIFTETAGGVTLAAARKLIAGGRIRKDDGPVVICITGNGLKTQDPLVGKLPDPGADRPAARRVRRSASDLDLRRRHHGHHPYPDAASQAHAGQGRGHRDRQHDRRADRQPRDAVPGHQGAHLRRERPGAALREHLRQRRGHPLPARTSRRPSRTATRSRSFRRSPADERRARSNASRGRSRSPRSAPTDRRASAPRGCW